MFLPDFAPEDRPRPFAAREFSPGIDDLWSRVTSIVIALVLALVLAANDLDQAVIAVVSGFFTAAEQ
jgi:hypothetical protein